MNPKALFFQGLVVGAAANLIADAMSNQAREKGATNAHIMALGLLLFATVVLVWIAERE